MANEEKPSILMVDDNPANLHILAKALEPEYDITMASNGQLALKILQGAELPDLILLDIMMPDMDGYEVCRRLKEDSELKNIPVIFITALESDANQERGLQLGAVDYVTKPFNLNIVQLRIKNHLELKQQRDILARLSATDGLTGIANRRAFAEKLASEWKRASRLQGQLALLLIDIDLFKAYNDTYGHLSGDECLQQVAKVLQQALCRPGDMCARFGGEEFACILPDTDTSGATHIAGLIQEHIAKLALPHDSSSVAAHVTLSIGVASCKPVPGKDADQLVTEADRLLYQAKEKGRNRIEWC